MGENCRGRPDSDGSRVDETLGGSFRHVEGVGENIVEFYGRHLKFTYQWCVRPMPRHRSWHTTAASSSIAEAAKFTAVIHGGMLNG